MTLRIDHGGTPSIEPVSGQEVARHRRIGAQRSFDVLGKSRRVLIVFEDGQANRAFVRRLSAQALVHLKALEFHKADRGVSTGEYGRGDGVNVYDRADSRAAAVARDVQRRLSRDTGRQVTQEWDGDKVLRADVALVDPRASDRGVIGVDAGREVARCRRYPTARGDKSPDGGEVGGD